MIKLLYMIPLTIAIQLMKLYFNKIDAGVNDEGEVVMLVFRILEKENDSQG